MVDGSENDPKRRGAAARAAVRAQGRAALATLMADGGMPYASLVVTACDPRGAPLMLLSDLAEHTQNLKADARAGLLFDATAGHDNPLTGTRVTLIGTITPTDDDALASRYLVRHPDAELYAGFGDFRFYRMAVARCHVVAGFGAIHWLDGDDYLADPTGAVALEAAAYGIVQHMNDDHDDAVALYATELAGCAPGPWTLSAIDCDGIDLRCGDACARVAFEHPATTADDARNALIALVRTAREMAENR